MTDSHPWGTHSKQLTPAIGVRIKTESDQRCARSQHQSVCFVFLGSAHTADPPSWPRYSPTWNSGTSTPLPGVGGLGGINLNPNVGEGTAHRTSSSPTIWPPSRKINNIHDSDYNASAAHNSSCTPPALNISARSVPLSVEGYRFIPRRYQRWQTNKIQCNYINMQEEVVPYKGVVSMRRS